MGEDIIVIVFWLGFIATIFFGWYFYIRARNKERMSLIEKGKDVSEIYAKREIKFRIPWLKLGIISTGFSIGWLVAATLAEFVLSVNHIDQQPFIMGTIFLFTAVSVIIAYFADKPKTKNN